MNRCESCKKWRQDHNDSDLGTCVAHKERMGCTELSGFLVTHATDGCQTQYARRPALDAGSHMSSASTSHAAPYPL